MLNQQSEKWSVVFDEVPTHAREGELSQMRSVEDEAKKERGSSKKGLLNIAFQCKSHGIERLSIFGNLKENGGVCFVLDSKEEFYTKFLEHLDQIKRHMTDFDFDCSVQKHASGDPRQMMHSIIARNEQTARAVFLIVQLVSAPMIIRNGKVLFNTFTKKCGLRQSFSNVSSKDIAAYEDIMFQVTQTPLPLVAEEGGYEEDDLDLLNTSGDSAFGLVSRNTILTNKSLFRHFDQNEIPDFVRQGLKSKFLAAMSSQDEDEAFEEESVSRDSFSSLSTGVDSPSLADELEEALLQEKAEALKAGHERAMHRLKDSTIALSCDGEDLMEEAQVLAHFEHVDLAAYPSLCRQTSCVAGSASNITMAF